MRIIDEIIETSAKVADQVAKVAGECIDKSKDKISELSLENELNKAQRQLGALVYALHKTGEQNEELLNQYIDDVTKIELQLNSLKAEEKQNEQNFCEQPERCETDVIIHCPNCSEKIGRYDVFCRNCGTKVND